jgi:hypothetical protein
MSTKREGVPEYDKAEMDEPVFVLRAQDQLAPEIVGLYALSAIRARVDPEKVRSVRRCEDAMRKWQAVHGCKVPD